MSKNQKTFIGLLSVALIIAAVIIASNNSRTNTSISGVSSNFASLTLTAPLAGTFDAGQTQKVSWTSMNYQAPTVRVALIRKVSDNPARYELVRVIAPSTKNDGSATWVPAKTDVNSGLSIQVGCDLSSQACTASIPSSQLAVVDNGRFANTASVFQSIEANDNK